jgi:CheY-like chemotaxis protein
VKRDHRPGDRTTHIVGAVKNGAGHTEKVRVGGNLLLIATAHPEDGDRFAQRLSQIRPLMFVFAHDVASTLAVAASAQPDLIIVALESIDAIRACEQLRKDPETRELRVLLVMERDHLPLARTAGATATLMQPASAILLALATRRVMEQPERRTLWLADRRDFFRGGRRTTDIDER